ncbi:MAG: helix-turn-helix domain-containing protein [Clostridiales bacterium]|nr:helix-turn-helix domain-containing protein [Clostridiales bacterium]
MKIKASQEWLPVYEALASKVRLRIIEILAKESKNIKELAQALDLSSAIMTMHVRKLEEAGIVTSQRVRSNGGIQKLCSLAIDHLDIEFPKGIDKERKYHQVTIPVGHYTDFNILPTCGLATRDKIIGYFDDPRYFLDVERVNAKILWFMKGYIEYRIPNHLLPNERLDELEISMELGSEAPGYNNNWPSKINFYVNDKCLGQWTSPGDFGDKRGRFTPAWWSSEINQYGILKVLKVNEQGSWMDGVKISDVKLQDLNIQHENLVFRIEVSEEDENPGGLTLYGAGFGNYDQDIIAKLYYN